MKAYDYDAVYYENICDLEIDRRDNDGGYSPSNCRWSTRRQNTNNRSNTFFVCAFGERLPLSVMSEKHNVSSDALYMRIKRGQSPELAIQQLKQNEIIFRRCLR